MQYIIQSILKLEFEPWFEADDMGIGQWIEMKYTYQIQLQKRITRLCRIYI